MGILFVYVFLRQASSSETICGSTAAWACSTWPHGISRRVVFVVVVVGVLVCGRGRGCSSSSISLLQQQLLLRLLLLLLLRLERLLLPGHLCLQFRGLAAGSICSPSGSANSLQDEVQLVVCEAASSGALQGEGRRGRSRTWASKKDCCLVA